MISLRREVYENKMIKKMICECYDNESLVESMILPIIMLDGIFIVNVVYIR